MKMVRIGRMESYLNAGKASSYKRKKGEEKDDNMPEC
jgi:hypothetical protein